MRVLACDTATALTAVALCDIDAAGSPCPDPAVDLVAVDDPPAGGRPGHAQKLLALTHELLERSEVGWERVDRIAVGVGPGTFTGLRIGIATAQALAAATGLPLVGISTLRALALAAHDHAPTQPKLAVIDARRGEAFVAGWGAGDDPLRADPALSGRVLSPEELVRAAAGSGAGALAVGDGALKFRELLEAASVEVPAAESPLHRVSAREHCRIAVLLEPSRDGTLEPQYLRLPDAELAARR